MTDSEARQACGCIAAIVIVPLIGIGLRAREWGQFLTMAGIEALALVMIVIAIGALNSQQTWYKVMGIAAGIYGVASGIALGAFLLTGNFQDSVKYVSWAWSWQSSATPAASTVQATGMSSPQAAGTATLQPTPVAMATPAATPAPVRALPSEWRWLTGSEPSQDQILNGLNQIWALKEEEAIQLVGSLQGAQSGVTMDGNKRAIALLTAVALERVGKPQDAFPVYQGLVEKNSTDAYGLAAGYRLRFIPAPVPDDLLGKWRVQLENNNKTQLANVEQEYINMFHAPEARSWLLSGNQWTWGSNHETAIRLMYSLRADQPAFEFFQFLHSLSPLPQKDSFTFILLTLVLGIQFLTLPLHVRSAKLRFYPERATQDLRYGGCFVQVIYFIFVIWAYDAFRAYTAQWAGDGATFLWVQDVTSRDFGVLAIWVVLYSLSPFILEPMGTDAGTYSYMLAVSIAIGIGSWQANFPSAPFIFWGALLVVTALESLALGQIWRLVMQFENR